MCYGSFKISEMIPVELLLVREHREFMEAAAVRNIVTAEFKNDSLTAHNHFRTRNRSTLTAEVCLLLFSSTFLPPPSLNLLSPPLGGHCKDHKVKQNQSGAHITLCLPPFSSPGG